MEDVALTLGKGWGVVRELRPVDLKAGEQEIVFENIPAEADLSTFMVRSRRAAVEAVSWAWVGEEGTGRCVADEGGQMVVEAPGGAARWIPGALPPTRETALPSRNVRCILRSSAAGRRPLELIYRVTGISWEAHYQALVRGELEEDREALAVDFAGVAQVRNSTSRGFSNALVRLVGPGREPRPGRDPGPGHLLLEEDHPLADLWRRIPPGVEPAFEYAVVRRADLPPGRTSGVPLAAAVRVPAASIYSMDSEEVPLTARGTGTPLRKAIVFKNAARHDLGRPLPPGTVEVFLGGMRRQVLPGARLPFTAADDEIRVDLGATPDVRGWRRAVAHVEAGEGRYEAVYEITVDNGRHNPIVVEVSEKPPPLVGWMVLSSTEAYTERANRLFFRMSLPPATRRRIQYTLRVRQPSL